MQIIISLQENGMVVLGKVMGNEVVPMIWFEDVENFNEFIRMARTMSYCFKLQRKKNDLPIQVKAFIEQLDVHGI